jgi:hypothetical protein
MFRMQSRSCFYDAQLRALTPFLQNLDQAFCYITDFSLSRCFIVDVDSGLDALRPMDVGSCRCRYMLLQSSELELVM